MFQGGLTIQGSSNVNLGTCTSTGNGSSKSSNAISVTGTSAVSSSSGGSLIYVNTGCANFNTTGTVDPRGKSSNQGVSVWDNCGELRELPAEALVVFLLLRGGIGRFPTGRLTPPPKVVNDLWRRLRRSLPGG